jgi:hypothetical protein
VVAGDVPTGETIEATSERPPLPTSPQRRRDSSKKGRKRQPEAQRRSA